jgi:hypothetical protein
VSLVVTQLTKRRRQLKFENRDLGAAGEPTPARALELAMNEWHSGNRDRELRLHLLFLSWYCNLEPPHLTGLEKSPAPSGTLPHLFQDVYETFADGIADDVECMYVVGLIAHLTPWLLGGDVAMWESRSAEFRRQYRVLMPDGLPPSYFEGKGAYGDYFSGQVRVPEGF